VRGIKEPITEKEKNCTGWPEGCRKDIERDFGVFKSAWQCLARPFLHDLEDIADRVSCCLLLQNMLMTDRVIDCATYNFRQRYDLSCNLEEQDAVVDQPEDSAAIQNISDGEQKTGIGVANAQLSVQQFVCRADRFK
jgi:hypothetical protein